MQTDAQIDPPILKVAAARGCLTTVHISCAGRRHTAAALKLFFENNGAADREQCNQKYIKAASMVPICKLIVTSQERLNLIAVG